MDGITTLSHEQIADLMRRVAQVEETRDAAQRAATRATLEARQYVPFSGLTAAECELLDLLAEECAEVIAVVSKIKRHGWDSGHPDALKSDTNRRMLEKELGHVEHAASRLCNTGNIHESSIISAQVEKAGTIGRWLHHQHPE